VHIPPETIGELKLQTERGLGYQVVSVMLKDGRRFDQVVTSEGCIIEVRGYAEVPFTCHEVASLTVNHRNWNFRTWSDKGKLKSRAADSGQTLSDFLLAELQRLAARPTRDEMLTRIHSRRRVTLKTPAAVVIREERESA